MTDSILPVMLDKGINTVVPQTLAEPGTLIDCLNYEMTADTGYRRIDGFERFDGWVRGEILDYYRMSIVINDPAVVPLLVPGATIEYHPSGVVVATIIDYTGDATSGILTYAPLNGETPIIPLNSQLRDVNSINLQFTTTSTALKGSLVDMADEFVENIRTYSTTLRNATLDTPRPVAGVHWFRNNAIISMDSMKMTIASGTTSSLVAGVRFLYQDKYYRVLERTISSGVTTLYIEEAGNAVGAPSDTTIRVVGEGQTYVLISTPGGLGAVTLITGESSRHASMFALHNPANGFVEPGRTQLLRSVIVEYENGLAAGAGILDGNAPSGTAIRFGPDVNTVFSGTIHSSQITTGTLAGGNAKGYVEIVLDNATDTAPLGASIGNITSAYDLMTGVIGPYTKIADIVSAKWSYFPGTVALRETGSRYVWNDMNFKGTQEYQETYGATGASPAFWAKAWSRPVTRPTPLGASVTQIIPYSCGSIRTNYAVTNEKDWPRYTAFHCHRLALGFEAGSVQLSVPGQPCNFSGFQGGTEVATGDFITGLVEAQSDSLIVFGKKSIRRIVGAINEELALQTISSSDGAFHYTAIALGGQPVYVGPAGISTLEQAQEYGDFRGTRASAAVQNTLVPKLVYDWSDTTVGSVAMAAQVREKNQYRLWLTTGEVYVMTLTTEGPKIMKSSYNWRSSEAGQYALAVPFAWTSNTSDTLKEHFLVVWDTDLAARNTAITGETMAVPSGQRIYHLERGWGFDGVMMPAWFDLAHVFPSKGTQTTQLEKIRMYGLSHGYNHLDVKTAGIETDFEQTYHTTVQDISMPSTTGAYYFNMRPVTSIIDQANWGLGIKVRINNTIPSGSPLTEPPVICQVLNLYVRTEGALDA